ncbi:MAG: hypothetical protein WDW36_010034 [Sanguina aurantia]
MPACTNGMRLAMVHRPRQPRAASPRPAFCTNGAGPGVAPHEVQYSLDAIIRTLWRMAVSRRLLLQWQTSSDVERHSRNTAGALWRLMWIGPALAIVLALVFAVASADAVPSAR